MQISLEVVACRAFKFWAALQSLYTMVAKREIQRVGDEVA